MTASLTKAISNYENIIVMRVIKCSGVRSNNLKVNNIYKLQKVITKVITYRNYKKFHEEKFLNDLKQTNIIMNEKDPTKTTNLY